MKMKKKQILSIITILTIVITGVFSFYQVKPHKLTDKQKQSSEFQNTMHILENIASVPHTAGSEANYKVRDYLLSEIDALGLEVQVMPFEVDLDARIKKITDRMAEDSDYNAYMNKFMRAKGYDNPVDYVRGKFGNPTGNVAQLHNILVKLKHSQTNEGIMLVSHYDSVPTGPGAGDDGISAAGMLNFLQQAVKQNDFKNDIYFLFTDGEEQGLLGAYDFVENNPQMKENIKAVFNFEARGNDGGLIMFESSEQNYDLVGHLDKAVPQPITFSIATAIYDKMPNDTDFSVFKRAGYNGLNFAAVEGDENYHESSDTVDNLNKDTAYQYMQTIAGVGNYFGKLDLTTLKNAQKGLFFPFLGLFIVVLPEFVGYLLVFLPILFGCFILAKKQKEKTVKIWGVIRFVVSSGLLLAALFLAYPASYMLSIPLTIFASMQMILNFGKKQQQTEIASTLVFLSGVFSVVLLFVPLVYMIHIALHSMMITGICLLIPLSFIGFYFWQLWKNIEIDQKEEKEKTEDKE